MREERTIGRMLHTLLNGYTGNIEILVSIPDTPTWEALMKAAAELGLDKKVKRNPASLKGKALGKPTEINQLMDLATGDFWVLGDGDTYFGNNTINTLVSHFKDKKVMAVTGRPRSADGKGGMFAYWGSLLADAAHHRREQELLRTPNGFFPVSGYLYATRPVKFRFPADCLAEDAYYSYMILEQGGTIAYEPAAEVFVYYPKTWRDFLKQKKRSAGGYVQLHQYGVIPPGKQTRSLWHELKYFWFPVAYAANLFQMAWSLILFPARLWLWIAIWWERKVVKKSFDKTWERVESTK